MESEFLPWWNQTITVRPASADNAHCHLGQEHSLAASLSHVESRQVANDHTIRFDNKLYQIARADVRAGLRDDANRRVIVYRDQNASGDKALVNVTNYDQLGRVALTQQLENAQSQSATDLTAGIKVQGRYVYSGANLYQLVSNPYRAATSGAASSEATMGWTVTKSDQNGRVVSVERFAGSGAPAPWGSNSSSMGTVSTGYDAQYTTVTDEAGNGRQSRVDGLARLAGVVEDPGATPHLNFGTAYSYDALGDLTGVNQSGRTRAFGYDSLQRLTQATNPESGMVAYTYDSNGDLLTKTDARQRTTAYTYDPLDRVIQKQYSDGTPAVLYVYDQGGAYSAGRLTGVVNSNSATLYTSFDALGRVLGSSQTTQGQSYSLGYGYNLAGALVTETYPSGRVVASVYDGANRLASVGVPAGTAYDANGGNCGPRNSKTTADLRANGITRNMSSRCVTRNRPASVGERLSSFRHCAPFGLIL